MKRLQITILERQIEEMDRLIEEGQYTSKSEVIRYALREMFKMIERENVEIQRIKGLMAKVQA